MRFAKPFFSLSLAGPPPPSSRNGNTIVCNLVSQQTVPHELVAWACLSACIATDGRVRGYALVTKFSQIPTSTGPERYTLDFCLNCKADHMFEQIYKIAPMKDYGGKQDIHVTSARLVNTAYMQDDKHSVTVTPLLCDCKHSCMGGSLGKGPCSQAGLGIAVSAQHGGLRPPPTLH